MGMYKNFEEWINEVVKGREDLKTRQAWKHFHSFTQTEKELLQSYVNYKIIKSSRDMLIVTWILAITNIILTLATIYLSSK